MDSQWLGKALIVSGALLVVAGVFFYFGGRIPTFGLGRLPGDIRVEREHVHFYFPITSSIVVSIILTMILYLISRFR